MPLDGKSMLRCDPSVNFAILYCLRYSFPFSLCLFLSNNLNPTWWFFNDCPIWKTQLKENNQDDLWGQYLISATEMTYIFQRRGVEKSMVEARHNLLTIWFRHSSNTNVAFALFFVIHQLAIVFYVFTHCCDRFLFLNNLSFADSFLIAVRQCLTTFKIRN